MSALKVPYKPEEGFIFTVVDVDTTLFSYGGVIGRCFLSPAEAREAMRTNEPIVMSLGGRCPTLPAHVCFSLWPLSGVCCPLRLRSIGKLEVKVSVHTVKPFTDSVPITVSDTVLSSEGSRIDGERLMARALAARGSRAEARAVMGPCTSHATPGSCRGTWPPPGSTGRRREWRWR